MAQPANEKPLLSKRELEVLQAVARGASNQEIARELVISVNTVRVHLRNIFAKLEVQSRTEATMRAVQEGWVIPPAPTGGAEEEGAGAEGTVFPAATLPRLAVWQRVYLAAALALSALVLATPMVRPVINPPRQNPLADRQPAANLSPPAAVEERWTLRAEMPTARSRLGVAAYQNRLYLIGGERTSGATGLVEVFDPAANIWHEVAGKPTPVANIQAIPLGGEIFVPGGCADTTRVLDELEIFNPAQNHWRSGAPLPQPLCAYAAAALNGELYVIGGWNGEQYLNTVYIYNPADDAWRQADAPYPLKVGFAAAAVMGNRLYVAGGYDGEQEYADVYALKPSGGEWQAAPSMNHPRGGLGLVAVQQNLYAIGGGWTTLLSSSEKLAAGQDAWQELETPYADQWRNMGVAAIGAEIFAVGGWNEEHLNTVMVYKTVYKVFIPLTY